MANQYPQKFKQQSLVNKEIGLIHAAATWCGMDTEDKNPDSEYRSTLWTIARVRSCKDLDFTGRRKVLDHFKSRGWNPKGKKVFKGKPANVKEECKALMGKVEALLADMKLPWSYAAAIAKRQTLAAGGIERLEWLDAGQLHSVVTALVKKQIAECGMQNAESKPGTAPITPKFEIRNPQSK